MGYCDRIATENEKDIMLCNSIIKSGNYQSKDFMYEENKDSWVGDSFTLSEDGHIYFNEQNKQSIKISGLCNIYDELDYWLLIDENKITEVFENVSFDNLPINIQEQYQMSFKRA
ncbi:MAG: hypothetical protein COB67_00515 [SAR324 cluster bacterium]|uniref:Uncharacterized protein n=1 Tax=SAR324 cluster bacterium TaxID=2024889 RepID=A0A2A4TC89_9DELT|nr:MAG: hypothetical protein COB67_00515 [SAR324 cluster bacterium]